MHTPDFAMESFFCTYIFPLFSVFFSLVFFPASFFYARGSPFSASFFVFLYVQFGGGAKEMKERSNLPQRVGA